MAEVGHTAGAAVPPPPCGEGSGMGVAPDQAKRPKPLYAAAWRSILNHPHPCPTHKGEGVGWRRIVCCSSPYAPPGAADG